MGAGIAQLAIEAGYETVGREVTDELGTQARDRIAHFLQRKVDKERMTRVRRASRRSRRFRSRPSSRDLADCDLVIEAIVEDLEPKLELFAELEGIVRADAILATNTSALSVTEIAAASSTPERVVGMHFFNPAPLMPLVEIVRAELSSDEAVEAAFAVGERLGKRPIRCHDTPGFVVNRVLIPLLNDCLRVLDEARVSPGGPRHRDDRGRRAGRWGRARSSTSSASTCTSTPPRRCTRSCASRAWLPPPRIVAMRNAGLLGRKSGRGFYRYDD